MLGIIHPHRRQFLGVAATTPRGRLARLHRVGLRSAPKPERVAASPSKRRANASLEPVKQIATGLLSVGYAEAGCPDSHAVVLLHGWPHDISSYLDVAPLAGAADIG